MVSRYYREGLHCLRERVCRKHSERWRNQNQLIYHAHCYVRAAFVWPLKHGCGSPPPLLSRVCTLWLILVCGNQIVTTEMSFPGYPWSSGTPTDRRTRESQDSSNCRKNSGLVAWIRRGLHGRAQQQRITKIIIFRFWLSSGIYTPSYDLRLVTFCIL